MDDKKLYTASQHQMKNLLKITESLTKDTCMEFGIQKYKTMHLEKDLWTNMNETGTLNDEAVDKMSKSETYKYLDLKRNRKFVHSEIQKKNNLQ